MVLRTQKWVVLLSAGSPALSSGGGAAQPSIAAVEQQLSEQQAMQAGWSEVEEQLRQLRQLAVQLWQRDLSFSVWKHEQLQQPQQQQRQPSCHGVMTTGAGGAAGCLPAAAKEGSSGNSGHTVWPAGQGTKGQEGPALA